MAESDEKEVFAHYGRTAYFAQAFERELVNLIGIAQSEAEASTKDDFDKIMSKLGELTLGRLLKRVPKYVAVPDVVMTKLRHAHERRNWLVHSFFYDNDLAFASDEGRITRLAELFREADKATRSVVVPIMKRLGLTEQRLAEITKRLLADSRS